MAFGGAQRAWLSGYHSGRHSRTATHQLLQRMGIPEMTRLLVLAFTLVLAGCATTHVTAFRDPAFSGRQYGHLAVFVMGTSLEARQDLEQRICKGIAPTGCSTGVSVLPPVRDYTSDEMGTYILRSGADAVLIFTAGADKSNSGIAGYYSLSNGQATTTGNTSGTINAYGNTATYQGTTTANTYATGQTTTIPIMYYSRAAVGEVQLFDVNAGSVAWKGEMQTSGRGVIATSDDAFVSSEASKLADELRSAGLIAHR
jgi:hypothetical protein